MVAIGITEAAGYEVDLSVDPPRVQVVKKRKPLRPGYGYQPGADVYRSTIKVGSQNWKRAVAAAKALAAAPTLKRGDYCDAIMCGKPVTGWVLCDKDGKPALLQIEGQGGYCAPIDKLDDVRPVVAHRK